MSDVLNMQEPEPETPEEEKGSWVSAFACRNSYTSLAFCIVK
ncbi:MAG: hypothetical protein ACK5MT_18560 [Actinomycetales bacterium]